MSHPMAFYDYWQELWDKYAPDYLAECRSKGIQAGLSDFQVYCEDNGLVVEDEAWIA